MVSASEEMIPLRIDSNQHPCFSKVLLGYLYLKVLSNQTFCLALSKEVTETFFLSFVIRVKVKIGHMLKWIFYNNFGLGQEVIGLNQSKLISLMTNY